MAFRFHRQQAAPFLRLLAPLVLLAFYIAPSGVGIAAARQSQSKIPYIPDNPFGVNVFLQKEVEPWKIEQTLRMIAAANIQWIKQEFPWDEIEFKKGYFTDDKWNKSSWENFDRIVDLATAYNLRVIARIDHPPAWAKSGGGNSPLNNYSDLADFTNALLERYKGRVIYVQLWNEPNLSAEWIPGQAVDPAQYAAMLKAVYPAIKSAHPNAVVLSAPMAMTLEGPASRGNMNELDYWTGLYAAGAKGDFDIVLANGYGLDQPPEDPPDPGKLNFRRVELLHDIMVKNGDNNVPVWFSEYGWNTAPASLPESERNLWRHVTPQQQAEWTVAGVDYARKNWPWAGVINTWYFRQVGDISPDKAEYYFAMVDPAFIAQPVYNSVKVYASNFPGPASKALPTPANPPPSETTMPGGEATPTSDAAASPSPEMVSSPTAEAATPTQVAPQPTPGGAAGATPSPGPGGSAPNGGATLIMYIAGGLLVVGGIAGLAFYFIRGKSRS